MSINDPIGDMLTRIRNGQHVGKKTVESPASIIRESVLKVLKDEGYIRNYRSEQVSNNIKKLIIELKYFEGSPVIRSIERVSKPSLRIYSSSKNLGAFKSGLGIRILSTPKGVISDMDANSQNIGGEIICQVF